MTTVPIHELDKIPYVDSTHISDRTLSTLHFYDEGEWHLWFVVADKLEKLQGWPAEGFYFSKSPVNDSDVYLEFLNFIAQRACWPEVIPVFLGIRDDLFNMMASLKKFHILYEASFQYQTESSRFVVTELEYLFSLCRSVFDLLQELISKQWDTVRLTDQKTKKKKLPKTFSKVLLSDNRLRSAQEIYEMFSVPSELANYYVRHGSFFQILRTFRDRFVHGGSSIDSIYVTEKGFAVSKDTQPFNKFPVWNEGHELKNGLCSLRPPIAHIVRKTLEACDDYAHTINCIIKYPPPMVPNMRFYMTGPFTSELHKLGPVLKECRWVSIQRKTLFTLKPSIERMPGSINKSPANDEQCNTRPESSENLLAASY